MQRKPLLLTSPTFDSRRSPSSLYGSSSPGRGKCAAYTLGGRAHGGPPVDGGLYVGNSRQISLPPGARSSPMRLDHAGLIDGGKADRNYRIRKFYA